MAFTLEDLEEAYSKLRSYIYHDNTDLFLRRQLVEFETGITKNRLSDVGFGKSKKYPMPKGIRIISLQEKLKYIKDCLNNYHEDSSFFDELIDQIDINFYPKKLTQTIIEPNFITNKKSIEKYTVSKVTPFISAPIELHIISVLWIKEHGVKLDAELGTECLGNRLILNKDRTHLVQGSSLFKPYFSQYQRWRDKALEHAKHMLDQKRDVAFVSLDIKEYFSSVQIPKIELYDENEQIDDSLSSYYNLKTIFLNTHVHYTEVFLAKNKNSKNKSTYPLNDDKGYVLLPIGLVSSYVLANYYLKQFDESVNRHIKTVYYGRYVDDLLFVIADPVHPDDLKDDEFTVQKDINKNYTFLEKFISENFSPILSVGFHELDDNTTKQKVININGAKYRSLYCQSDKSLAYLFDSDESHLVIDKLKEELRERTSEFRDFPDEEESKGTFTDAAYHLQYEDSKEKVRTLKDYKEDRFGLTLFLANKIFSSLRQEEELSDEACNSILKFFKYKNAIEFYRLWEKIFTLFLVNNKPKFYVAFYLQCIQEIDKLQTNSDLKKNKASLKQSLSDYLDIANEITFSLNLAFYDQAFDVTREFEFKTEEWSADIFFSISNYEPTRADAYWRKRFRKANMLRHHYVIHPLLNYTKASRTGKYKNLVNPHIDFREFELDEHLLANSPRRIKFWESNMAQIFVELGMESKTVATEKTTDIFLLNKIIENEIAEETEQDEDGLESSLQCMLNESYELFQKLNRKHIPRYEWQNEGKVSRDKIYKIESVIKSNSPEVWLNEIRVNNDVIQDKFKIAFANTRVEEDNILKGIRGKSSLNKIRIRRLGNIIRSARKENADILLFPEFFIPIDLLSSIVDYARKNEKMVVTGLEHVTVGKYAYNFIVTILPVNIGGVKDAVIIPRLKNHYAHVEQHIIEGNHMIVPKPSRYRYDLCIWNNLYFSSYYCFELANIHHRGLWKNKIDLAIGVEWNKDTPYYSNIVEATSRDLHCFFAQVNTSQFGDSRLTQPVESALKDILRLKGGDNDALLVATFGTKELRDFQRQTFSLTHQQKRYKPLPPDFDIELVLKRINNKSVLDH
ncbi:reverse transcriptase domain-containing protein [Pedobacter punctiformis]|uniref:Reverse transcriptase domain-containing protein n=1 Tax=Pedobacter punctiformis TaxID=3004097 RepID=A0ABT4L8J6_9SPHI|nr:reverse transcriptase domain-containing protein [Pedobacter sp. HCMS5-2]MCZ4244257.1 hypothetical protein [Pedobacter sp. HCMS5-2]